jgi:geranylgeranyl pyrophosphate synthase
MHSTQAPTKGDIQGEHTAIERELEALLASGADGDCGDVQEAMRYAVLGGGKRVRPILSLRIADMLDNSTVISMRAAAAVELFHCASLIVDDLPCMDNEFERRGRPTTRYSQPSVWWPSQAGACWNSLRPTVSFRNSSSSRSVC